jgi:hypothetical protein
MMWLYVGLVAVVCAAVPATVWLKRAGDRAWRAHRIRVLSRPIADAFLRFQIDVVDNMTPALQQLGREVDRMANGLRVWANSPAMREFARDVRRMQRGDRP